MISDIWAGYNEPSSNRIDLFYEFKSVNEEQEQAQNSPDILTPQQRMQLKSTSYTDFSFMQK